MFYNETETMGRVIQGLTNDVTGAYALTFLLILLMLFLIAVVFRLSFELIVILVTPIILVLMAYSSDFLVIGVIWLILDAVIIAKNIIIK